MPTVTAHLRERRWIVSGILVASVSLSICAAAPAANPQKGKTYSGTIKQSFSGSQVVNQFPISFTVSKNGKKVGSFKLPSNVPIYCQGGGFGGVSGGSASVSKGKFKAKLPIVFAPTHEKQGFAIITGAFKSGGRESGSVTTAFTKAKDCNGKSPYTTKAK
jgi:hypothetical protein